MFQTTPRLGRLFTSIVMLDAAAIHTAMADLTGDWREELIVSVKGEMRIYGTTIPARDRRRCLMQDPLYRMDVVAAAMGYTQRPMLSVDLASQPGR